MFISLPFRLGREVASAMPIVAVVQAHGLRPGSFGEHWYFSSVVTGRLFFLGVKEWMNGWSESVQLFIFSLFMAFVLKREIFSDSASFCQFKPNLVYNHKSINKIC